MHAQGTRGDRGGRRSGAHAAAADRDDLAGVRPRRAAARASRTARARAARTRSAPACIGGMLTATFLAPFLIPMFFVVISREAVRGEGRCRTPARLPTRSAARLGRDEHEQLARSARAALRRASLRSSRVARCSRCTSGPPRRSPPTYPDRRGVQGAADRPGSTTLPAADIGWRDFMADPRLQRLVEIALENNRDLRVAALNVAADAGAVPHPARRAVSAGRRLRRRRALAHAGRSLDRGQPATVGTTIRWALSASWEIDFFGRLRSLSDAALAAVLRLRAGAQGRRDPARVPGRRPVPDRCSRSTSCSR